MANYRICPQCAGGIAPDKKVSFAICSCGWFDENSQKEQTRNLARKAAYGLVGAMVLVALLFNHVAIWGDYSAAIPVLRLRQVTGLLGANGYGHLANACMSVGKSACAENAFEQMAKQSKRPEALLKLARLESRLGKIPASVDAFQRYTKAGGKDGRALLAYGRLLEFHHQDAIATKIYKQSLKQAKNDRDFGLQAQATSGVVGILIRKGKYRDAYVQLQNFRGSDLKARGYLNVEFTQVRAVVYPKGMVASNRRSGRNIASAIR